jgi:hypothetical protein
MEVVVRRLGGVIWLSVVMAACAAREAPENGMVSDPDLVASLDVRASGDTAHFGLHVTNVAAAPVAAEFA